MEFSTSNPCTTAAAKSELTTALSDLKCVIHRASVDVGSKSTAVKIAFLELAVTASKETFSSFMERVIAVHTVTKANEDMNCTIVKSDSDTTD